MEFFEDFTLVKREKNYLVRYKGDPLLNISMKTLEMLLVDKITGFNKSAKLDTSDNINVRALKLATVYGERKREFYFNKNIEFKIDMQDPNFKHLVQAINLIDRHAITYKIFLEAQIFGLKFINSGKGVFPKPSQLSTTGAEDRLLQYIEENEGSNSSMEIRLTKKDYDTPLSDNEIFNAYSDKIIKGIATLKEAKYVQKLLRVKKGKTAKKVEAYIEDLS